MFLRQINFSPRTPRGVEFARKTTDAETGIESSGFLKSETGEYLTSRQGEFGCPGSALIRPWCYKTGWT